MMLERLGIGLQNDGEVDTAGSGGHEAVGNIGCGIRNASGLLAAQPGCVLDVDWPADARAEGVDGIFSVHGDCSTFVEVIVSDKGPMVKGN